MYDECIEKGYIEDDALDMTNYGVAMITTDEWDPEELKKLAGRFYLRYTLGLFFRKPGLFLRKYSKLVITKWRFVLRAVPGFISYTFFTPNEEPVGEKTPSST